METKTICAGMLPLGLDVTRETLPVIPLKGGVEVVRTQRRLVLRDFHD
jgi:hypothetical protein